MVKYYTVTTGVKNEIVQSVNHHRFNNGEIVNVADNVIRIEADEALIAEWLGVQNCDPVEYPTYEQENYSALRQAGYLPISEYIDAKTKQASSDPIIYKAGVYQEENYHAHNLAVKMEYPK